MHMHANGSRPRNILAGRRYDLGATSRDRIAPTWVHLGVTGAGVALGLIAYPYHQMPMGMLLMGAAGSIVAVGMLLLVYDLVRDERIMQVGD
jgi:hypothetical protein